MYTVHEPNKKPKLAINMIGAENVTWKYSGYLTDPRCCIKFKDGSVLMSGILPKTISPETGAENIRCSIEVAKHTRRTFFVGVTVSSVDWKYGESVHDKRLVFYLVNGDIYISGPFPREVNVPLLAQSFFAEK